LRKDLGVPVVMGWAVALVPVVGVRLRGLGLPLVGRGGRQDLAEDLVEVAAAVSVAVQFPSKPDSSSIT
jgi:hypothetical protein